MLKIKLLKANNQVPVYATLVESSKVVHWIESNELVVLIDSESVTMNTNYITHRVITSKIFGFVYNLWIDDFQEVVDV